MRVFFVLIITTLFIGCAPQPTANEIIRQSIEAHGFHNMIGVALAFDFRDKHYTVQRDSSAYTYTRSFTDSLGYVKDVLINSIEFTRTVDGNKVALSNELGDKYANSVNSVLYFFQLPLPLNDPAVKSQLNGQTSIDGSSYYEIKVWFSQEGGGTDFEDVFLYWVNTDSYLIDYLAYSYQTNGGGMRFRKAINRKSIKGFVFQDYINYKPLIDDYLLTEVVSYYESGNMQELSRIENKNVTVTLTP